MGGHLGKAGGQLGWDFASFWVVEKNPMKTQSQKALVKSEQKWKNDKFLKK